MHSNSGPASGDLTSQLITLGLGLLTHGLGVIHPAPLTFV